MKTQSWRATLVYSVIASAIWCAVMVWNDDASISAALILLPVFFVLIFATMLGTNRLTVYLTGRMLRRREQAVRNTQGASRAVGASDGAPVAPSERPEHAQRRRSRRGTRGGDRRRR